MMIHLGVQRPLGQRLFQFIKQAVFRKRRLGVGSRQKLFKQLIGNSRLFPSRHMMPPSIAS